jgi:hypothetical protein
MSKHHKTECNRIEELERAVYEAKERLLYAESALELARDEPLPHGWHHISTAPEGEFVLVSTGIVKSPVGQFMVVARHHDGRWIPMFSTGEYCGAKYWQYLPKLPCED